jgi:hypothetical protein
MKGFFVKSGHPVFGSQLLLYPITGVFSAETFCKKNPTIQLLVV